MRQLVRILLVLTLCVIASSSVAAAATLYDGTLGTLPAAQGWLYYPNLPGLQQVVGNATVLDTTSNQGIQVGYSPLSPPVFDRNVGYTITFDVRVAAESHASNHRAGFSLISLDKDMKGIELGFWQDHIWAQNDGLVSPPLFTHGEDVAFDTTAAITRYTLSVDSANYHLRANGNPTPILSGALRDYTASGLTPYNTPNLLFFGDDTISAAARIELGYVAAVPEPATWAMLLGGAAMMGFCCRCKRRGVR
jgi:hypothetical protein